MTTTTVPLTSQTIEAAQGVLPSQRLLELLKIVRKRRKLTTITHVVLGADEFYQAKKAIDEFAKLDLTRTHAPNIPSK